MSRSSSSIRTFYPHAGFVFVYILWGINLASLKIGGREWDSLVFNGLRFASMIPILWVYTYFYYRSRSLKFHITASDLLRICALGILNAIGMEAMLQYALQFSNSANGAVLGRGFMPVITVLIALLAGQVRLSWRILLGIPLALGSVIIIVSGGASGFHLGGETLRGDVLLLMRSVMGAIYLIGMNRLVQRYPLPMLISFEMTAGAISLLPFVLLRADAAYLSAISATGWLSLIYTSLLATALGFSLHNWSLAKLGPFKSSAYGYLLPVTAALAGYFILHESISFYQVMGGAGVLTAMYLVQADKSQAAKQAAINNQTTASV
ncbi:DMT family transporter [Paenibacillus sp. GCM10023248]|uniref:DMT family transporter n=1 Tax=Bacillales TaxID=1385 RepID=UPI002379F567|nr:MULTISPECIES: DMT family transporter [Bacillales]MDD9271303.1 DMT family transporter [Paenibacillus sp. MAHUQ-63]MDR6881575.1 drug/metabolite transporter (DMT)-like permease [Bacillus sp. 3255]